MDNLTKEQRRKNMQSIRSKNTLPERMVMKELRRQKIYFASHVASLPGKPDIVFRRRRIAVFVDSDFWHKHPKRFRMPDSNQSYWKTKINGNKMRDRAVNRELKTMGWKVMRFWEYDVKHDLEKVIEAVISEINLVER